MSSGAILRMGNKTMLRVEQAEIFVFVPLNSDILGDH